MGEEGEMRRGRMVCVEEGEGVDREDDVWREV